MKSLTPRDRLRHLRDAEAAALRSEVAALRSEVASPTRLISNWAARALALAVLAWFLVEWQRSPAWLWIVWGLYAILSLGFALYLRTRHRHAPAVAHRRTSQRFRGTQAEKDPHR